MGVRAPADKRFRRSHVKPLKRRRTTRAGLLRVGRTVVVFLLVAYALYRATDLVLNASALAIDRIEVRGHTRLSTGEVLALVDDLRGENILTARLETWRDRLITSPWVKNASLRKVMPSTIDIVVTERLPIAFGRVDEQLYLVDARGAVIDEYGPQYADFDLPIIDGLIERVETGPSVIDPVRARLALRFMEDLESRPDLARRVSQFDVADASDVVVLLDGDGALLRLGNVGFSDRIHAYLEMAEALRERVPEIDYVDLRFGERVYVRPVGSDDPIPAVP
ncbi:MAG: FtsQ-type POTRA domain-containing protein [Vicinamibacterales bacterium]|jgi:cell division protein FtsQ|nr:hypothetical protein [Acidobacteriota bacterium]MDP7671105.1 FtsQ-type POTRA domain-containing protein [Vicinamibacterales bacterium]HJO39895.1 FtsQ-type POTRA domain-containing protein [Vicinamibacterales bacterium]|tara:strand:+ start:2935 stop:3774 length:840 start_codon:yes stop_codon:yes gene_type:complete